MRVARPGDFEEEALEMVREKVVVTLVDAMG